MSRQRRRPGVEVGVLRRFFDLTGLLSRMGVRCLDSVRCGGGGQEHK